MGGNGGSGGPGDGSGGDGGAGAGGSTDNKPDVTFPDDKTGAGSGGSTGNDDKGTKGGPDDKGGAGTTGSDGKPFDAERAQKTIDKLREGEKTMKDEIKSLKDSHQKSLDGIALALGLKPEEVTTDKLQEQLKDRDTKISTLESENRSLKLRGTVDRVATSKNAIPDLVWGQLFASGDLATIDPAASDLDEQIGAKIDDVLRRHPQLKRTAGHRPGDAGERGSDSAPTGSVNDIIRSAAGRG